MQHVNTSRKDHPFGFGDFFLIARSFCRSKFLMSLRYCTLLAFADYWISKRLSLEPHQQGSHSKRRSTRTTGTSQKDPKILIVSSRVPEKV
ncbi:hypothetical protein BDN70DRAFT_459027 [Pholiota conissans]|uniref:Uncharacterized protein n=1 Tax=Pholiota conissans TaxID=109636 RepID=A0A9P6D7L4_9AGAR|nr:hypothetical protein BDN70DRAFT_459027 [Pholiota conissans]